LKTNEHGVSKMCEAMENLIEDALDEERKTMILRMLVKKYKLSDIVEFSKWPVERILELAKQHNLQPVQ